jgi:Fur family ferric uptake transcriptional regulator
MVAQPAQIKWRLTLQRRITAEAIAQKYSVFTPESLAMELRDRGVSRSTVYRTVELLYRMSLVARVSVGRFRGFVRCDESQHHHHFACTSCGRVYPFASSPMEGEILRMSEAQRILVREHVIEIAGSCAVCLGGAAR